MMWLETFLIGAAQVLFTTGLVLSLLRNERDWLIFPRVGSILLLAWVVWRSWLTAHAPFSGAYESMVFFMFVFSIKTCWLSPRPQSVHWLNLPVMLLLGIALLLPLEMRQPNLLVPALQSPWIYIHVPVMFLSYASLTYAMVLAVLLAWNKTEQQSRLDGEMKMTLFFLTAGIFLGAFWGEQAWGSFWNWDNKEIWALVTWLIVQVYFHVWSPLWKRRVVYGAFAAMLFTYFGVMFLLSGLHSYK